MKLYRYSPIEGKDQLVEAIKYAHFACHRLCMQSFGAHLSNTGNIGIFCHYDDEYDWLVTLRKVMTEPSDNPDQKYFRLYEPITIPSKDAVPETTYTHPYIRHPDPYRHHVGDIDFYLEREQYDDLKHSLTDGKQIKGARIFPRNDLDMIELYDPGVDTLSYIVPTR